MGMMIMMIKLSHLGRTVIGSPNKEWTMRLLRSSISESMRF